MSLPIDHARLPRPGDIFAEKYRLECILGSGGMGVVFGALHLLTHKRVAIKWLAIDSSGGTFSDTTQRFMREARLAGEFHHPNVVQMYDVGEAQGSFFMVMEWLVGESLAGRLERVRRLSFQETLTCLVPCMRAIQRAHDADIIHRDIKPANIFLCQATADKPALAKVLDFGISKRMSASPGVGTFVTQTGMLIGTPHYLAPEQLRARPVDRRTDIYGFGVLLYETLAGVLPFTADNFGDLIVQISMSTPRSLRELVPDLPLGVEQVVLKAMARNPDERYPTLDALIAGLEAIDDSPLTAATLPQLRVPSSLSPIAIEPSSTRLRSAPPRRVLALLAAAAISAAGTGLVLHQSKPRAAPRAAEAPPSLVRPRALPPPTATVASAELLEREIVIPSGLDALPSGAALGNPVPGPQLDAAVDSGKPTPLQSARALVTGAAGAGEPSARSTRVGAASERAVRVNGVEPALPADPAKPDKAAAAIKTSPATPSPLLENAQALPAKPSSAARPTQPPPAQPASAQPSPAQPSSPASPPTAASPEHEPHDNVPGDPGPADENAREHNPLHMDIQ